MNSAFFNSSVRSINNEMLQLTLDDIPATNPAVERNGGIIIISDYGEIAEQGLKESAKKLLDYVLGKFTAQNSAKQAAARPRVTFDIREYAELTGYDISTENKLKEFRKQINSDLNALYRLSVKIKDRHKGSVEFRVCQAKGLAIGNGAAGTYFFELGNAYAEILITNNLVISQPRRLFLAGKSRLAYPLGKYLATHYGMDNNQNKKTHDIISVKAILEQFKDYKGLLPDAKHTDRPKTTLETALEELEDCGVLTWFYCGAKKAQIDPPATYAEFEKAYIHFDIVDAPDTSERRQRKAEEQAAAAAKPKRTRKRRTAKEAETTTE